MRPSQSGTLRRRFSESWGKNAELYSRGTLLVVSLLLGIFLFTKNVGYIGLNYSESLPTLIFYVDRLSREGTFQRGDYLVFHHPGDRFVKEMDMVKKLICLPGDVLTVDRNSRKFYCNGSFIGTAKQTTRKGEPAPLFIWNGAIPEGKYFVMGIHPDSYDSRYYGFVSQERIIGKAYPLLGKVKPIEDFLRGLFNS